MCPSVPCYWLFYSSGRTEKCTKHGGLTKSTHSSTDKRAAAIPRIRVFPATWDGRIAERARIPSPQLPARPQSRVRRRYDNKPLPARLIAPRPGRHCLPKGQECKQRVDSQSTRPTRSSGSRKTTRFSTIYPSVKQMMSQLSPTRLSESEKKKEKRRRSLTTHARFLI